MACASEDVEENRKWWKDFLRSLTAISNPNTSTSYDLSAARIGLSGDLADFLRTERERELITAVADHYNTFMSINGYTFADVGRWMDTDVRTLIDGILLKICPNYGIRWQTEVTHELSGLPHCKFDYLLLRKSDSGDLPIGCIETKRPSSMGSKAFVQAALELFVLQQVAHKHGVDVDTSLFCVLTDGYRFVFIVLQGRKLKLEYNRSECTPKLQIRCITGDVEFANVRMLTCYSEIITQMCQVVQLHKAVPSTK